jgi:hypothetical protein
MLNEVMNANLDQIGMDPAMLVFLVLGVTFLTWAKLSAHQEGQ